MRRQLSAKDKAFEKERTEFRKQIRELNHELNSVKFELYDKLHSMQKELDSKNGEIENLRTVIDELKEYAKIPNDELEKLLKIRTFEKEMDRIVLEYLREYQ